MKGEIWLIRIPSSDGHEQSGTRPAILIAQPHPNICILIPLTSNAVALRFPHTLEILPSKKNVLSVSSIALVFQIRAIDKKRLERMIGTVEEDTLENVNDMITEMLGIS